MQEFFADIIFIALLILVLILIVLLLISLLTIITLADKKFLPVQSVGFVNMI